MKNTKSKFFFYKANSTNFGNTNFDTTKLVLPSSIKYRTVLNGIK